MRFSKKVFISTVAVMALVSHTFASDVDTQIVKIQNAPVEDRYKMMNELKLDILNLQENKQIGSMQSFLNQEEIKNLKKEGILINKDLTQKEIKELGSNVIFGSLDDIDSLSEEAIKNLKKEGILINKDLTQQEIKELGSNVMFGSLDDMGSLSKEEIQELEKEGLFLNEKLSEEELEAFGNNAVIGSDVILSKEEIEQMQKEIESTEEVMEMGENANNIKDTFLSKEDREQAKKDMALMGIFLSDEELSKLVKMDR
jgi:hypothetical protein